MRWFQVIPGFETSSLIRRFQKSLLLLLDTLPSQLTRFLQYDDDRDDDAERHRIHSGTCCGNILRSSIPRERREPQGELCGAGLSDTCKPRLQQMVRHYQGGGTSTCTVFCVPHASAPPGCCCLITTVAWCLWVLR